MLRSVVCNFFDRTLALELTAGLRAEISKRAPTHSRTLPSGL